MTKVDPLALRAMLLDSVRLLAASADKQNAYIAEHHVHHDELALELDDLREAAVAHCELPADQIAAIDRLVARAVEWRTVRQLAQEALVLLGGDRRRGNP